MHNLLNSELFRSRKRAQTWISIGIVLVLDALLYGGLTIAAFVREDNSGVKKSLQLSEIYGTGIVIVSLIGTISTVVFASSLIGSEFGWNTLRPLLARAPSRAQLLGAKWMTAGVYVLVIALLCVVGTMAMAIVSTAITGGSTEFSVDIVVDALALTLRVTMGLAPYAALALFLALLLRSNAAGIAIGIAVSFIEPIIFALLGALSDVFDSIQKGGISWNVNRVFSYGGDNDYTISNVLTSSAVLTVWIAGLCACSFWVFRGRDVTSG